MSVFLFPGQRQQKCEEPNRIQLVHNGRRMPYMSILGRQHLDRLAYICRFKLPRTPPYNICVYNFRRVTWDYIGEVSVVRSINRIKSQNVVVHCIDI